MTSARSGVGVVTLLLLLLLCASAGFLPVTAWADDATGVAEPPVAVAEEPPEDATQEPGTQESGTQDSGTQDSGASPEGADADAAQDEAAETDVAGTLEEALAKDMPLVFAIGLIRIGSILLGIWVLIRGYRRWSGRRAGLIPPGPGPAGATTISSLGAAVLVLLLYFVAQILLAQTAMKIWPEAEGTMTLSVVVMTLVAIPLIAGYAMRRGGLRTRAPDSTERVLGQGFLAFCVGNAVAIPAALVSVAVLSALGQDVTTYQVVEQSLDAAHPENLWITAFLAILVAPVVEETLFRGLLYPAMRDAAGGGRRGVWVAAIVSSALFAAVHAHAPSFLPLFCLAMVLVIVFEWTDSLRTVIVAHALFNAASMVPLLLARMRGIL